MYSQMGEILNGQFVVECVRRIHGQAGKVRQLLQSKVGKMALNCEVDDVGAGG